MKLIALRPRRSRPVGDNTVDRRTRWYAAYTPASPVLATAVVGAGDALAWVGAVLLGGSHSGLPQAVRQIEALRALGVKVAIDDFGSGYACLNYLRHFPADVVKLDPSIVASANCDERGRRLLEGFVTMCHHLDLQIVAEGGEFHGQLALLREAGVGMGQGFLLGVPAAVHELAKLVDTPAR